MPSEHPNTMKFVGSPQLLELFSLLGSFGQLRSVEDSWGQTELAHSKFPKVTMSFPWQKPECPFK